MLILAERDLPEPVCAPPLEAIPYLQRVGLHPAFETKAGGAEGDCTQSALRTCPSHQFAMDSSPSHSR
jgi:hypothetical protein